GARGIDARRSCAAPHARTAAAAVSHGEAPERHHAVSACQGRGGLRRRGGGGRDGADAVHCRRRRGAGCRRLRPAARNLRLPPRAHPPSAERPPPPPPPPPPRPPPPPPRPHPPPPHRSRQSNLLIEFQQSYGDAAEA